MKKDRFSATQLSWMFVLFHVLMVAYAILFLHPYYGSNDEFSLMAIASGAVGDYTHYFIYIHSGFAWILKFFYTFVPSLNWYTLVMYGMIFLSLTSIGLVWIRRSKKVGAIMSVMLVLLATYPLYVEMQYTKTAAAVTAAGYVIVFFAGRSGERKKDIPVLSAGILFLLLGSWIRFHSFGMVSLLAFGLWIALTWKAWEKKEWKHFLLKDCAPCVIAFALVFGSIALENALVYTPGSPEAHYKEYDKARQKLLDYGVPEWDEYEAEYEALGLKRTDVLNLQNWLIADYDRYTEETFHAIIAFRQDRPFQWEYLIDYLVILAMKPLFLLSVLGLLLWLRPFKGPGKREKSAWIAVISPYLALLGVYLYFIKIYRVLPIVVTACLLSVVVFVWSAAEEEIAKTWEERLEGKRFFFAGAAGMAVTAGLCVNMLIKPAFQVAPQDTEPSAAFRELYDTISRDKELYYVFDPFTNNGVELAYSIFEKLPDGYLKNIFALGGWETESPQTISNLWEYDQRSLLTSLYMSDKAVLISNTLMEHIMLHLQDTYDGIFITYSKVNQIGNFDLFALNYKMSGLKESEDDSATLDRTYTAENERYDVFEATVNMTPEELEGKSVFLWMQSVESGKKRMYQGTWQQMDENGLYSMLYDTDLEETNQVKFMIPKMSYPLDDRYNVHVVIHDEEDGIKLVTENNLY